MPHLGVKCLLNVISSTLAATWRISVTVGGGGAGAKASGDLTVTAVGSPLLRLTFV